MTNDTINKLKNVKFGVITLIFALFLLVNITMFFEENSKAWERIVIIYLLMTAYLFSIPDIRSRLFEISFIKTLPRFLISALIGYIVISAIGLFFLGSDLISNLTLISVGLIIVQSFIVGVCEESMFREYFENQLGKIPSNILFGMFHYTAYLGNIFSAIIAFVFGMILSYIKIWQDKNGQGNGLITIIALHAGANLAQIK